MRTLVLTREELSGLICEDDAFEAMEIAFKAHGEGLACMPSKIYLDLKSFHGDFRAMPAYVENLKLCGLKWVNSHPDNILKKQFPAVMAVLILNDPETGFPLAIMDGTYITKLRTGAAGALASFYLSNPKPSIFSLIGCGVQAESQLLAHLRKFRFEEVRVWGPKWEEAVSFQNRMKSFFSPIVPVKDLESCVKLSDIICTTTPSRNPLLMRKWIKAGAHINAIGADAKGKQELDPQILKDAFLVVDEMDQSIHGGEVNVPFSQGLISMKDIDATLGEIVCGRKKGRNSTEDVTVFDSTGLAIQDIALGHRTYEKALKTGVGQLLNLL